MSCDGAGLHRQSKRANCDNGPRRFSSINLFFVLFFKLEISHLRGNLLFASLYFAVYRPSLLVRDTRDPPALTPRLLDARLLQYSTEYAPCIFLRLHGLFSLRYMEFVSLRGRLAGFPPTNIHSPSFKQFPVTTF